MLMYLAEFKLRFGSRKWYVRRIVEADSYEKAVEIAKKYAELMNRGEVKWELADVYGAERPLLIGEEELKKLE